MGAVSITRRAFVGLGATAVAGAALLAGASCSASDGQGDSGADAGDSGADAQASAGFEACIGMEPQEAWSYVVDAGWWPKFKHAEAASDEERGLVVSALTNVDDAVQCDCMDAEGAFHWDLEEVSWSGTVMVGLGDMLIINTQLTYGTNGEEAEEQLREAGFTNISVVEDGDVDPSQNRVAQCVPSPGAWALPEEQIVLTLSSYVEVPDVMGKDPGEATSALVTSSLEPNPAYYSYIVEEGVDPVVVAMDPAAGEVVRVGTTVKLEYSEPVRVSQQ